MGRKKKEPEVVEEKKAEAIAKPSPKEAPKKTEVPKSSWVFSKRVVHGTAGGSRLVFEKGDEPKGLSAGEIETFKKHGMLDLV